MSQSPAITQVPVLRWKPYAGFYERDLKIAASTQFLTLKGALQSIDKCKRGNIVLISRIPTGWMRFEYLGPSICQVNFSQLQLGGLPLGGDPITPQTYIRDGSGCVTHIVQGYQLEETQQPIQEPLEPWAVEAIVPKEVINHGKNVRWHPRITLRPSLEELPTALTWVHQHMPMGIKVKAGGSKHSWSNVAQSRDIYIEPDRMKLSHTMDGEPNVYHRNIGQLSSNLVRVGSGTTVKELNRFLWEKGKSLPFLGGFDGQTLGGVFPTGTHGSVFTHGPLAEMIVSIDLVLADGGTVRIEPSKGITDSNALSRENPDIRLIQNDDYYYAALINMGSMGVVHSYLLEVTDAFHMNEIRTLSSISEVTAKLQGGKIYNVTGVQGRPVDLGESEPRVSDGKDGGFIGHPFCAYHLEFLLNPHGEKVIVTSRHPTHVASDSRFEFNPPGRDLMRTIHRGARFGRPALPTWLQEHFRGFLAWGIDCIVRITPSRTPWLIDSAMKTIIDDAYTDRSFNVFNTGDGTNQLPALAGTIYIPVLGDDYLAAVHIILKTAAQYARFHRRYQTGPVSMRFVKGTHAFLGSQEDVCAFEFIFTASTKYALEMLEVYEHALHERFDTEKVKVHWGQLFPGNMQRGGGYANFKRWKEVRDHLDPYQCFINDWQAMIL